MQILIFGDFFMFAEITVYESIQLGVWLCTEKLENQ